MSFAQQVADGAAIAQSQNNDLAVEVFGFVRVIGNKLEQRHELQVEGGAGLNDGIVRSDLQRPLLIGEFEGEAVQVRAANQNIGDLEIISVERGLQAGTAELGGDELGGDIQAAGWRGASLQQIGCEERQIAAKGI